MAADKSSSAPIDPGLKRLCANLRAEPLLAVSMGSKELFHSNLLGWMAQCFPTETRHVFAGWLTPKSPAGEDRVRREFKHLDLVIEFSDYQPLVLENKVFAIPDEGQLARYTAEAVRRVRGDPALVLLSLTDPGWAGGVFRSGDRTWRWVSFGALAERLGEQFGGATEFDRLILAHEARLVSLLDEAIRLTGVRSLDEPLRLPKPTTDLLESSRLADVVEKVRAHQVMRPIRDRLADMANPPTRTEVGFTNGLPLLAAFWDGEHGDGVGWQYQGGQWRLAMVLGTLSGRGPAAAARRAEYAARYERWFDFNTMYKVLGCTEADVMPKRARTPPDGFNKYDPDFVYRYRRLPEVTVRQFVDLALAYSAAAADWAF